jgi:hypothetical protein
MDHRRFHPAWKSLALDYLAIQAASVSAERAFSAGGVEPLQFLKPSLHSEILFPGMLCSANEPALIDDEVEEEAEAAENYGLGIWDACLADEEAVGKDDEDIDVSF